MRQTGRCPCGSDTVEAVDTMTPTPRDHFMTCCGCGFSWGVKDD